MSRRIPKTTTPKSTRPPFEVGVGSRGGGAQSAGDIGAAGGVKRGGGIEHGAGREFRGLGAGVGLLGGGGTEADRDLLPEPPCEATPAFEAADEPEEDFD